MDNLTSKTRILIATAGFGEGHNSAAKGLKYALGDDDVAQVMDPCTIAAPKTTERIQNAYRKLTVYSPRVWKEVYRACGLTDFSKERTPVMRKVRNTLGKLIEEKEVEALLSTHFIYPYFLERHVKRKGRKVPVFTVVTDSIEVNKAWLKAPCDHWFVADHFTRMKLINYGLSSKVVHEMGFPVHSKFTSLPPVSVDDPMEEFRILFFPTKNAIHMRKSVRALLSADERVKVTLVMGKNVRSLYRQAHSLKIEFPGRLKLVGWTKRVHHYLAKHHLIIGKAGGATVHEAIASNCPMIVNHLVPGQEEGNLELLEASGCGKFIKEASAMTGAVQGLLSNEGEKWRLQKGNMKKIAKPDAAQAISEFVLNEIS